MSPDLDPAIVAAGARTLAGWLMTGEYDDEVTRWEAQVDCAVDVLTAAAPLIRAQEREAVAAELLAIAVSERHEPGYYDKSIFRQLADRLAPEHVTPIAGGTG